MLINVLIQIGDLTPNLALRGPKKRFGGIGRARPTCSVRAYFMEPRDLSCQKRGVALLHPPPFAFGMTPSRGKLRYRLRLGAARDIE